MTSFNVNEQCLTCKRFAGVRPTPGARDVLLDKAPVCSAFPTGIPPVILRGDVDHNKPFDGDGNRQRVEGEPDWFRADIMADGT